MKINGAKKNSASDLLTIIYLKMGDHAKARDATDKTITAEAYSLPGD